MLLPNFFQNQPVGSKVIREMDRQADRCKHHDHVSLISIGNQAKENLY